MIHDELKKAARHAARLADWFETVADAAHEAETKYKDAAEARRATRHPGESTPDRLNAARPLIESGGAAARAGDRAARLATDARQLAEELTRAAALGATATAGAIRDDMRRAGLDPDALTDAQILKTGRHAAARIIERKD